MTQTMLVSVAPALQVAFRSGFLGPYAQAWGRGLFGPLHKHRASSCHLGMEGPWTRVQSQRSDGPPN